MEGTTASTALFPRQRSVFGENLVAWTFKLIAFLVGLMPPTLFVPMGRMFGRVGYIVGARKNIVQRNIATAFPYLSADKREQLVRETYENTCISLFWYLHIRAFDRWRCMTQYVDIEFPTEYLEDIQTGPLIMTSAHFGCWELLPCIHAPPYLNVRRVYEIYRPLHNAKLNQFVLAYRQHDAHIHLLPDKQCLPALTNALAQSTNDIVALVCDQRPSRHAVQVQFLDTPTNMAPGAGVLHARTQRPVWFTTLIMQAGPKPFRLVTLPIARGSALSVDEVLQRYASILTDQVSAHPSQYLWLHNLWSLA
ncbi:hypothetical protein AeMF1_008557 [Aphanomyces euteiches]|nr:hypothetical protein AeMF1_008557 [Aphanomyces euteiches]KAH9196669.1 hypothetical protein AeNC1_001350 [Aphanomyces euteiches]